MPAVLLTAPYSYAGLAVSSPAVAETIPSLHLYLERDGQAEVAWKIPEWYTYQR